MKLMLSFVIGACIAFSASASANWNYSENVDPMTDEDRSMAAIFPGRNEAIVVRCNGSSDYDIIVGVGDYLGSNGPHEVVYRVDKEKPIDAGRWGNDTEGRLVFVPQSLKSDILYALKNGSHITFQVTDFQGSTPYAKFPLQGSSAAIDRLACI